MGMFEQYEKAQNDASTKAQYIVEVLEIAIRNGDTADPAMNSGNHVMLLGDLITWEYEYLAGIRPLKPGFAEIELKPYPIKGLDYVNCSYDSIQGKISSSWKVENGVFKWDVEVPAGIRTEVYIPGETVPKVISSGKHHFETTI